ncbi:hypothetical protein [Natrarchaeobaculum sulfurireducens]|nr:hypothetical protein [Natrarchaeobaculum sulfurireducens]
MSSATDGFGPFCGALGCTNDADVVICHPEHGRRTVCDECADGYEVIADV